MRRYGRARKERSHHADRTRPLQKGPLFRDLPVPFAAKRPSPGRGFTLWAARDSNALVCAGIGVPLQEVMHDHFQNFWVHGFAGGNWTVSWYPPGHVATTGFKGYTGTHNYVGKFSPVYTTKRAFGAA